MRSRVVVFRLEDERFAVPAAAVEHAVDEVGVRPLPALPRHIAGVVRHGRRWIAAIDPAPALTLRGCASRASALILRRGRIRYALLVDAVTATRDVDPELLQSLSDVRAGESGGDAASDAAFEGMSVYEGRHGLVTLFDPERLFTAEIPAGWEEDDMEQTDTADTATASIPIVAFRLGGELFGIDVARVDEAFKYREPTPVPDAPAFLAGTVMHRDEAVPVVDLRTGLELEPTPPGAETRILVVSLEDDRVGFIVDAVADVLRLDADAVREAPAYVRGLVGEYLEGIARTDEELLLLLRPERILNTGERAALRATRAAGNGG